MLNVKSGSLALVAAGLVGCTMLSGSSKSSVAFSPTLPNLPKPTKDTLDNKRSVYSNADWDKFNLVVGKSLKHAESQQLPADIDGNKLEVLRFYFPIKGVDSKGVKFELKGYDLAHHSLRLCLGQTAKNFTDRDPNFNPVRANEKAEQLVDKILIQAAEEVGK